VVELERRFVAVDVFDFSGLGVEWFSDGIRFGECCCG